MRAIERAAIDSGRVSGGELMERAGAGVVAAILAQWPDLATDGHRAGVLAGPGNNGGDGFVIARLLAARGWDVEVFFYGDPEALPPDAGANWDRWCEAGGAVSPIVPHRGRDMRFADPPVDLWVDALFGTGLTRPLPPEVVAVFNAILYERNWQENRLVAVDIPSGLHADTGERLSPLALAADLTVTFHAKKQGHLLGDGPKVCGPVVVANIGL
jgi:hydroxyethylthiazole kinase-like uncharacterized protein yjeF